MDLLDRTGELRALEQDAARRDGSLVFVWGRRRLGKTYLLQAFVEGRRAIFHTATERAEAVELADFTDEARQLFGSRSLPSGYAFPDWGTALDEITRLTGRRRLVVILDEFAYLARASRGLESVIQRWWDRVGSTGKVMLVLCGSDVAYMSGLAGGGAPLHQRATAVVQVKPMDHRAAGLFLPHASVADRAYAYGVLGGTPLFLREWNDRTAVQANLLQLLGDPSRPLVDAAEQMLGHDTASYEGAFRILEAIAHGKTRAGEIADRTRIAVERPLRRLVLTGVLEKCVPVTEDPAVSRRGYYRIVDPYFRLWFRHLAAGRAEIARGLGDQVVQRISEGLDDLMGEVFEDMARDHARRLIASGRLRGDRVGRWWSEDSRQEIDIVGATGRKKITFVGTVKWRREPLGWPELNQLDAYASALAPGLEGVPRLLVGRAGITEAVRSDPRVIGVSLADLFG